jgi:hypothetical protein
VEVIAKKATKAETGILTVLLSTYIDKEEKVFEGDLSVWIKRRWIFEKCKFLTELPAAHEKFKVDKIV